MEKQAVYKLELSAIEANQLDGKVNEAAQKIIDQAKMSLSLSSSLSEVQKKLICELVERAKKNGKLIRRKSSSQVCPSCGKSAGYYTYPRNGRYHKKGDINYDQEKSLSVIDYEDRSVSFRNRVWRGCCKECELVFEAALKKALEGVKAELPKELSDFTYKKYENKECKACGWKGHEGQLKKLPTMMGDGYYFGKCPSCDAENRAFGNRPIETIEGYTIIEIAPELKPTNPEQQ